MSHHCSREENYNNDMNRNSQGKQRGTNAVDVPMQMRTSMLANLCFRDLYALT